MPFHCESGNKMAMAEDLWRECAAWLTRCKVIPPDHKANWPDSDHLRVLALTLRDGVLLCNLINFLDPNADMKDFNRKPQMAQVRLALWPLFYSGDAPLKSRFCTLINGGWAHFLLNSI